MKIVKSYSSAIVSMIFLMLLFLNGCGDRGTEPKETLRPVKYITITAGGTGMIRKFPGVVDAANKAELSFRVSGKLSDILVKEGEFVKAGQVLARLEQTDYKIKLNDKQAGYDKAKADFSRAEKLLPPGYISRSDYDSAKAALGTSAAQLDAARQDLNYTVLKAPFGGRIAKRYVENFEEVGAKQEIMLLHDTSSFVVQIDLPENVLIHSTPGTYPHRLYAEFDAIKDRIFPLTVKEVATQADETTQTYAVTLNMPAIQGRTILPGMSVNVTAERRARPSEGDEIKIFLPAHAVMEDREGRFVYIVVPDSDNVGVVHKKIVTTGELTEQGIEVMSGLVTGDRVVTAGMSRMTEGKRVRLLNGDKK